ncbi:hypothetical protein PENPOL_c013G07918 [Penicillium polonicum]|uniref:Uncharacterized protein n=1 Tax=Penicillium polonicum TaxID=60169 RepID=A0A1V6NBT4_PENPO|nr:hypothetical protein PENPOL_c013G07918 [Penicillium polonicum]
MPQAYRQNGYLGRPGTFGTYPDL